VYLLRHGEAEPYISHAMDRDRKLVEHGVIQAKSAGVFLRDESLPPTTILCSPYQRTQQTAQAVNESLGTAFQIDDRLAADQSTSSILDVVRDWIDVPSLVVISHNPIISRAVDVLVDGPTAPTRYSMRTGELVGMEVSGSDPIGRATIVTRFRLGD